MKMTSAMAEIDAARGSDRSQLSGTKSARFFKISVKLKKNESGTDREVIRDQQALIDWYL